MPTVEREPEDITDDERKLIEQAFEMTVLAPVEEVSCFWHGSTLIMVRDGIEREGAGYVSFVNGPDWKRTFARKREGAIGSNGRLDPTWPEGNAIIEAFCENHHAVRLTPAVARKLLPMLGKLVGSVELLASLAGGRTPPCTTP